MTVFRGHYVMVVRYWGIEKIEEEEKFMIVILERVQSLLTQFSELVFDDLANNLPPMRNILYHIDLGLGASSSTLSNKLARKDGFKGEN